MERWFNHVWYERKRPPVWLLALEGLFIALSGLRRWLYRRNVFPRHRLPVPVIVIGNIAVGGTGKTPLTRHLCESLLAAGYRPGVISRGYGGSRRGEPLLVHPDDSASLVGDEPLMLARTCDVPVCIFPDRVRAGRHLLSNRDVNVILCDDGMQHYALERDFEIAVFDARRGIGNGHRLPAGPLRESVARLQDVDCIVAQGAPDQRDVVPVTADANMWLAASEFVRLVDDESRPVSEGAPVDLRDNAVAVAGIGYPERFFETLGELGIRAYSRKFADHHRFQSSDFDFAEGRPVIMTAKDAVKCRPFARSSWWYLDVKARFDDDPARRLLEWLDEQGT